VTREQLSRSLHITRWGWRNVHIGCQSTPETLKRPHWRHWPAMHKWWLPNLVTGDYSGPRCKATLTTAAYYRGQHPDRLVV